VPRAARLAATPSEKGALLVSGPYVVSKYVPDRTLVLTRNPAFNPGCSASGSLADITIDVGVDASQQICRSGGPARRYLDRLPAASVNQGPPDPSLQEGSS